MTCTEIDSRSPPAQPAQLEELANADWNYTACDMDLPSPSNAFLDDLGWLNGIDFASLSVASGQLDNLDGSLNKKTDDILPEATSQRHNLSHMSDGLLSLLEWLVSSQCELVAMEATGVYWMPVWKILSDGQFTMVAANAAHIKAVPGRKTDVNDATWIADLATFGLLKASFVPEEDLHELRTLMRTRKQLVREQSSHVQRIQKTLTEANIRLDSVISDIIGLNGRRVLEALIAGERNPRKLVALTDRRLKATQKQLYDALHGRLTDHHRFLLQLHLRQYDALDEAVRHVDREAEARLSRLDQRIEPKPGFRDLIRLLVTIPGVSRLSALTILSEIGHDMSHGWWGHTRRSPRRRK